ncbi:outer membrane protein [Novosphingobium sp. PhB165]|uniref:MipA/OmpV family protein n=1 Tax=Novosphingobium sp. PhB165 TaxID=2485105 RepID=UPI00104EC78D|nr:MipA/OmpV family protein [Novosphingobium sp. PhB165]TCM16603.1 outer membrane protein [Novosphingobium sp. PhB165]
MFHDLPKRARRLAGCAILVSVLWAPGAHAQSSVRMSQANTSDGSDDHVIIGAGVSYAPTYQGSNDYRVLPLPALDVDLGPFYANLRNGIGVKVINTGGVTIGGGVAIMPGYRAKDVPEGVGKLSWGVGGRMFASVAQGGVVATIGATKGFSGGTEGFVADASISYPVAVTPRLMVIPSVGTTWADSKYNDRYFGIDAEQSLASGLAQYKAGSGFKDASALLTASYRLTDRITLGISGGVTTLLGDAKDSPIVESKTQPTGFLTMGYRFR